MNWNQRKEDFFKEGLDLVFKEIGKKCLTEKEFVVIDRYYGIFQEPKTFGQIADELNCNKTNLSLVRNKALAKLFRYHFELKTQANIYRVLLNLYTNKTWINYVKHRGCLDIKDNIYRLANLTFNPELG